MITNGIIFGNKYLDVVIIAWFLAQGYKFFRCLIVEKRIDLRKFGEAGGMPSSHSASVASLFTVVGISKGLNSLEFVISFVFAIIVMYDAAGVRRAAGTQAKVLNKIADNIEKKDGDKILEENLKEILGHTPFEVLVGGALGIGIGILMKGYIIGM